MKKIMKYIGVLAFAAMSTACMDLEPQNQLSDPQVWSKAENYELFANQFYGYLRGFQPSVPYMCGLKDGPHSDLRSDLVCHPTTINIFSSGANTIPASDASYNSLYNYIYRTNLLLARADEYGLSMSDIGTAVGEAYFFRAYCHFELVQMFGDCLLVTTPMDVSSEKLYAKRTPRLEVVRAIIEDLSAAADMLPDTPERGRVGKDAAWAMLSRVALYEGTWQKFHYNNGKNSDTSKELLKEAWEAAEKVMTRGRYKLLNNAQLGGDETYRYMFIIEDTAQSNPANLKKSDNTEYILSRRYDAVLKSIEYNITVGTLSHADTTPTAKWADMYRCTDGLPIDKSPLFAKERKLNADEYRNRDARMGVTLLVPGRRYWNQTRTDWGDVPGTSTAGVMTDSGYANYKWGAERVSGPTELGYDWPVIRYAEVLLNYAEAKFEEQDETISDNDLDISLNEVRRRSNGDGMAKLSNSLVNNNGLSMREEIRAERTVELVLEGFRIDDLKRWKTAETEMPMDMKGVLWSGTEYESSTWTTKPSKLDADGRVVLHTGRVWAEKNYLLPIPSDQLQLNPALGQNPGWGK